MYERVVSCTEPAVQVEILASASSLGDGIGAGQEHEGRGVQGSAVPLDEVEKISLLSLMVELLLTVIFGIEASSLTKAITNKP